MDLRPHPSKECLICPVEEYRRGILIDDFNLGNEEVRTTVYEICEPCKPGFAAKYERTVSFLQQVPVISTTEKEFVDTLTQVLDQKGLRNTVVTDERIEQMVEDAKIKDS